MDKLLAVKVFRRGVEINVEPTSVEGYYAVYDNRPMPGRSDSYIGIIHADDLAYLLEW